VSEHGSAARLRAGFAAFAAGDVEGVRGLFTRDVEWTIPGASTLAGTYRGIDAVLAMLGRTAALSGGTYRVEPAFVLGDDEHAAVSYRATGTREGRRLELDQLLLCGLEGGRIASVVAVPADQAVFDAFWG
jgi:ketosteroid isomerase-like protein